eukprot:evm.model.scf_2216.1 EVM.evm.TU.scf_2216.1   scf_2216:11481-12278(+)
MPTFQPLDGRRPPLSGGAEEGEPLSATPQRRAPKVAEMGHVVDTRGVAHNGQFASQNSEDGHAPTPTAHAQGVPLQDRAPSSKKLGRSGGRGSLRSLNVSVEADWLRTPTFAGFARGRPESGVLSSWQSKVGRGDSPGPSGPSRPSRQASLPAKLQDQCSGKSGNGYGQAANGYSVEDQWSSDDDESGTGRESQGGNRTPTNRLHSSRIAKCDRGTARSPLKQKRSGGAQSSSRGYELDTGHSDHQRGVDRLNYDSKVMSRRHLN